jgi:hypothetical protein
VDKDASFAELQRYTTKPCLARRSLRKGSSFRPVEIAHRQRSECAFARHIPDISVGRLRSNDDRRLGSPRAGPAFPREARSEAHRQAMGVAASGRRQSAVSQVSISSGPRQFPKITLFIIRPGARVNSPVTTSARVNIQTMAWRCERILCCRARKTASGTIANVNNDNR